MKGIQNADFVLASQDAIDVELEKEGLKAELLTWDQFLVKIQTLEAEKRPLDGSQDLPSATPSIANTTTTREESKELAGNRDRVRKRLQLRKK